MTLATYHVSCELLSRDAEPNDSFCAVIVTVANRSEEASSDVIRFFNEHQIEARVVHVWEVA